MTFKDSIDQQFRQVTWVKLFGKSGLIWLGIATLSSLLLSSVEYGIALFIQMFLVKIGMVEITKLPSWAHEFSNITLITLISALIIIALIRMLGQLLNHESSLLARELSFLRLETILLYEMLISKKAKPIGASEVHYRISQAYPKASAYIFNFTKLFSANIQLLFLMIGIFLVAWKEAIIGLIFLGVIGITTIKLNLIVRTIAAQVPKEFRLLSEGIERVARNRLYILISRTQLKEYANLLSAAIRSSKSTVKAQFLASFSGVIPPFLGTVLLAGIILTSQSYFHTPASNLVGFLYLFVRFVQQLASISHEVGMMNNYYPQYKETIEILKNMNLSDYRQSLALFRGQRLRLDFNVMLEKTIALGTINITDFKQNETHTPPQIELNNLCYGWPNEDNIINNLSFNVESGEHIGIVGPSGVGKSTLLYLIFGLLEPRSGHVYIDGVDSRDFFEKKHLTIGYVGAEAFLIKGSIRDNLLYGLNANSVSDEEINQALRQAYLFDEISSLNNGLEHQINENAEGLSAGQKQRLALARAFLRKPKLLILDEASANLDKESEKKIAESIINMQGECTTIIVSHRDGILEGVNKKIFLKRF